MLYYRLFLFISLWLLLSFSAKAENNTYWSKQDSTATKKLYGNVLCNEGIPVEGLELILFSDPGYHPATPYAISNTKEYGSFQFTVSDKDSYLLELNGELGKGRIYIPAGTQNGRLDITYPVTEKIVILHTNDQHFTLNNLPEFSKKVAEIREKYENVFLFSAGDIFVRHPLRWIVNGRLMIDPEWFGERALYMINTMNELGYDLLTLGNHELDYREPYTFTALDGAEFPLLSANMEITTEAIPPTKGHAVLKTSTWRNIAVLGLTTGNASRGGIRELDFNETVENFLTLKKDADVIIALTHIGRRRDYLLAEEYPQFDVIVGGHSHVLLEEAEMVNSVLIAQAGGNPHIVSDRHPVYLGKIVLTLENGVISNKKGWVIEIIAEYETEIETKTNAGTEIKPVTGIETETNAGTEIKPVTGIETETAGIEVLF